MKKALLDRHTTDSLKERLNVMPAVVVTGARQTGKSTLARELVDTDRRYLSLDDFDVLDAANRDPGVLLDGTSPITLDEIQKHPPLLQAIKLTIDSDRRPGRFLLTGSANLLLMRGVSESLAGRASYLTLWPMTRREQRGLGACGVWEELFSTPEKQWIDLLAAQPKEPEKWQRWALRGGFPTPALYLKTARERTIWFDGYVRTYLERDLRDLSAIQNLSDFRRLMRAASLRLGQLINQTDLGRDVALPQPSVHRYLNLLEASYMLIRLPAFSVNRTKRLIKAPKLYWGDTALALHLADGMTPSGAHLENLLLNDLLVWRDARVDHAEIFYWRTTIGEEVDLVVDLAGRLIPIEVKSTAKPSLHNTRHLRSFRNEYGSKAQAGLLIHAGDELAWIAPDVLAVPWWQLV